MNVESNIVALLLIILLSYPESETATTAFITEPLNPTFAEEGKSFTLEWIYTLDGRVMLAQFFNVTGGGNARLGRTMGSGNITVESEYKGRFSGQVTNTTAELTILGMQRSEQLTCRLLLNPTGSGILTSDVDIIVHFSSSITRLSGKTVIEGENVTLACVAEGKPTPNIAWARLSDNRDVVMPLTNISRWDAGMYRCTAHNGVGSPATGNVLLVVQYAVEAAGFGINATVPEGGTKTFSCPVDGNPKPNISWYSEVSETPIFSGEKLKARESGCYTCVASNSLGKPVSIRHCLTVDEYSTTSASPTTASEGVSQTVIGVVVGVAVFVVILIGLVTWLVCKKKCRKHNKSEELQYAEVDQVNNGESLT